MPPLGRFGLATSTKLTVASVGSAMRAAFSLVAMVALCEKPRTVYSVSVSGWRVVDVYGGSVTMQAAPRRQSSRLAIPAATDSSKFRSRRPVIGNNCSGV